jgi:hypothetical protein
MLVYEDAQGNREFFFFINDRLWKRVRARNTNGARDTFDEFADAARRPLRRGPSA